MLSSQKINAIYNLRTAVEAKVRAEQRLALSPTADTRAALLHATLELEEKTQTAIEAAHHCEHGAASPYAEGNVIEVDFGEAR